MPDVRDEIVKFFAANEPGPDMEETNREMLAIQPDANGLISLAKGYATQEVT